MNYAGDMMLGTGGVCPGTTGELRWRYDVGYGGELRKYENIAGRWCAKVAFLARKWNGLFGTKVERFFEK